MISSSTQNSSGARASLFVSHHIATHKKAAARIKQLLESRSERLDVHISEDILGGDDWLGWIVKHIAESNILLILLPPHQDELGWIEREVKLFKERCATGRRIIFKPELLKKPDFEDEIQFVETSQEDLCTRFLRPLYFESTFSGLPAALNIRVSEEELAHDALQIREAIIGDRVVAEFGESLIVDTGCCNLSEPSGLDTAILHPSAGFGQILNWNVRDCRWSDLRNRAAIGVGKGTFWVTEMEEVITEIAQQNEPRVMSSTFRGRGTAGGKIFRPQLTRVETIADRPVCFHFAFYEVLVPELVRGPELIGAVYNLLHLAGRVRWEVLNPFLVKRYFSNDPLPPRVRLSKDEQHELIGRVSNSLRAIELEAERHDTLAKGISAFKGDQYDTIQQMFDRREMIKAAIQEAVRRNDFESLMRELTQSLDLNSQVMEILAERFLQLARDERVRVAQMINSNQAISVKAS
jgi:hypothetical protein